MHNDTTDVPASAAQFDYHPQTRVVFGLKSIERVGGLAAELGARNVLLVTDRGIVSAGHAGRVSGLLEGAGLSVCCFDAVEENPGTRCVEQCLEAARRSSIDTIVGLVGGSSLDTAKGCNFLFTNGGRMQDYRGIGKARRPMLPLIAIPTTGGTGSECQSFALITDEATHQKMACGDPKAAARIALLDPGLTVSQPPRVTACSGVDAIAHAVETAVTRKRTALSMVFSREALRLTLAGLPRVLASKEAAEIGQPGTDAEAAAIREGTVSFGRERGAVLVTLPLHDRNGEYIAAVRVKLHSFLGETQNTAVTRAMNIVKQMQTLCTSAEDL